METINFDLFGATGVLGTDTFETWRLKTNGIVEKVSTINSSYASRNDVLLLDSSAQTVLGNKIFSNGITVGGNGGNVPFTVNSSSELLLTSNVVIGGDKTLSASTLISGSGKLTLGGRTYQWPSAALDQNDGYVYHDANGNIVFKTIQEVTLEVATGVVAATRVAAEEITPVGAVIGVKLASAPSELNNGMWLKCDGSTIANMSTAYPLLYAALGNSNVLPDLRTKVLMGSSGATGFIGSTGATSAPSYYSVHYYIKSKNDVTVTFSLDGGNGVTLLGNGASSSIDIYGGTVSLNVGTEFTFDVNKKLLLSNGGISHIKLANASTAAATGSIGIPLRDTNGYVRGNAPGIVGPTDTGSILVNKAYVDNLAGSKDHKIRGLNGKGYNSYSVQPYLGTVFVNYDNRVKVYGESDGSRGARYGDIASTNARGYTLPIYSKNVKKVYSDTYNTYIKYADDTVYSYGLNNGRKTGVTAASANTTYLSSPNLAFGGEAIDEVILSYSTAETVYARTSDGRLWVAGSNLYGQLGLGSGAPNTTSTTYLPRATTPAGKTVSKAWLIGGGDKQTGYVLATDNTLWACGYGGYGQMGRVNLSNINDSWVPVLNPVTSSYLGGTTNYSAGTYTIAALAPATHGLQDYDIVKSGTNNYVVKVLDARSFQLCNSDLLVPITSSTAPVTFSGGTQIHKRMTGIANAAFGGTGGETFGYIQTIADGTLYAWGYGTYGQLGNGSTSHKSIPTAVSKTSGSTVKSQTLYTGLDHTVHFISTAATGNHLYACGRNNLGQLGIGQNGGIQSLFEEVSVANLSNSGLQITGNDYSVYRFFSPGTDCRFCVFQSGANKKLTAWGANPYNKLGTHDNAGSHNAPQNVYVENDSNVTDVQTTVIREVNGDLTTIMIVDDSQEYGDLHTCGYHYYSVGNFPDSAIVPYFTKSKNI
jgi:alpha-tubulin suppressor-like RCC1 family protein